MARRRDGRTGDDGATAVRLRTSDGLVLNGLHRPAAEPLEWRIGALVAHGFTGTARNPDVRRIRRGLAARGLGVLALDLRGHGASQGTTTAGADEVHDVAAGVAWLRERGYRRVVVLGWSMGGTAALRQAGLAAGAAGPDAVVSVSAPGTWERDTRPMRAVHWVFRHRTGRAAARLLRGTRIAPDAWASEPLPPAALADAIGVPMLVVHGADDHYFPLHHVDALAAAAPHAEVWVEQGMGHAEVATSEDLVARIAGWVVGALDGQAEPGGVPVCDDGARD